MANNKKLIRDACALLKSTSLEEVKLGILDLQQLGMSNLQIESKLFAAGYGAGVVNELMAKEDNESNE